MNDSEIKLLDGGAVVYAGEDAMLLFRAKVLYASLKLYHETGLRPARGVGPRKMLDTASRITKKPYLNGRAGLCQAMQDLRTWIDTMACAIPISKG